MRARGFIRNSQVTGSNDAMILQNGMQYYNGAQNSDINPNPVQSYTTNTEFVDPLYRYNVNDLRNHTIVNSFAEGEIEHVGFTPETTFFNDISLQQQPNMYSAFSSYNALPQPSSQQQQSQAPSQSQTPSQQPQAPSQQSQRQQAPSQQQQQVQQWNPQQWGADQSSRDVTRTLQELEDVKIEQSQKKYGLGLKPPVYMPPTHRFLSYEWLAPIPHSFDWRKSHFFVNVIRNQYLCGSCWAFSTVTMLSHRLSIATQGAIKVVLSPQSMLSCSLGSQPTLDGCDGGQIEQALEYLANIGTVLESAYPYEQTAPNEEETCATVPYENTCPCTLVRGQRYRFDRGTTRGLSPLEGTQNPLKVPMTKAQTQEAVKLIQLAIIHHGPIVAGIWATIGLQALKGEEARTTVFSRKPSDPIAGPHAIVIVGWGDELQGRKVEPYWIVQNSWGKLFGDGGFYYHIRGAPFVPSCAIENTPFIALTSYRSTQSPTPLPNHAPTSPTPPSSASSPTTTAATAFTSMGL